MTDIRHVSCQTKTAFDAMQKYKLKHGSSFDFCHHVFENGQIRRSYYSAEMLGAGWLRHVSIRPKRGKEVYYERPPGDLGKYSFSLIPNKNRLRGIKELQLEWPQFNINNETFIYSQGIIMNEKKFHKKSSLKLSSNDQFDSNFWKNYSQRDLNSFERKVVFNAMVKCLSLYFFTQNPYYLKIENYATIQRCEDLNYFLNFVKSHEFTGGSADEIEGIEDILFILIARVTDLDKCFGLPSNLNLILLLQQSNGSYFKDYCTNYKINAMDDEKINTKLNLLIEELVKVCD